MISSFPSSAFVSSVVCRKCGTIDLPVLTEGTGPHKYRANCGSCGTFVQWISARSPEEQAQRREASKTAAMQAKPPSEKQLALLQALHDTQPVPSSMAEASERISALLSGQGVRP